MQKVVIFGAGNCGKLIAEKISQSKEILCFIDNDTHKWGSKVEIEQIMGGG